MSDSDSDVEFVPAKFVPVMRSPKVKKRPRRGIDPSPSYVEFDSPSYVDFDTGVIHYPKVKRRQRGRPSASDVELTPARRSAKARKPRQRGIDPSASDVELTPTRRSPKARKPRQRGIDPSASAPGPISDKMPDSDVEANSDSDVETAAVLVPPKRRRMIDASAIAPVPIYSNKVFSCLDLNKKPVELDKNDTTAAVAKRTDDVVLPETTAQTDSSVIFTDSEDEEPRTVAIQPVTTIFRSPSPPPPQGSPNTRSTRANRRKVSEMNRKLNLLKSGLLTSPLKKTRRRGDSTPSTPTAGCTLNEDEDDDDREVTLKFRCRSVLHKVTVPSSAPLSKAVEELSVKIKLPPSRILLLMKESELPTDSTANELGLGIADIIDCVIIEEEKEEADENDDGIISIRIQNKERSAAQTYSIHRDAALGSVLRQYLSSTYTGGKRQPKVVFCFDGTTIRHSQTPSQLDMEDGDVIDVWA